MSGAVDEDVARTVQSGRETLGALLSGAQSNLQVVFSVFVVVLVGTIYLLWAFVWDRMKRDLLATAPDASVVAVTPFDVILLQVKVGLLVGVVVSLPVVVYYSRDYLRERGWWPADRVSRWKLAGIALMAAVLFVAGVAYGYLLFFPLAFDFLASNAVQAGFEPTYSIVKWAEFVFLLSLSFGLAAQLPLAMSALAYAGIVRYGTFRDYWKHAVLGLYAFGALFTPPDPLTQLLWATPLVVLYAFSLQLTKVVVTAKVSSERIGARTVLRERWNVVAGVGVLAGVAVYGLGVALLSGRLDSYLRRVPYVGPSLVPDGGPVFGLAPGTALVALAVVVGFLAAVTAVGVLLYRAVNELIRREGGLDAVERRAAGGLADGTVPASAGDPADIDLSTLDEAGVRAAPPEAFATLSEDEAVALASEAMDAGDPDRAQAILDRFDEAQALADAEDKPSGDEGELDESRMMGHGDDESVLRREAGADEVGVPAGTEARAGSADADAGTPASGTDPSESTGGGLGDILTERGAGVADAFSDDDVDEEDIGGYYYDFAFILDSLTSRAFRIVGLFMLVLAAVFGWLYTGGIGNLKRDFLRRLPEGVVADQVSLVTLHPVEALIFEIKVSTVIAAVSTLPLVLYYAWPALKERGFARGDRNVLFAWAGVIALGLVAGSAVGYLYVAPTIISWLAADVIGAHMVIAYRINNFGWLVFFTTVGVGLLADVPITMFMFHRGGLVPYRAMLGRWRVVTLGVLSVAALLSPRGVFTMFILGIPVLFAYGLGLLVLYLYTLGGRRRGPFEGDPGPGSGAETDTDHGTAD